VSRFQRDRPDQRGAFDHTDADDAACLSVRNAAVERLPPRGLFLALSRALRGIAAIEFLPYDLKIDRADGWAVCERLLLLTVVGQHGHQGALEDP
jgi:hypothetical protein